MVLTTYYRSDLAFIHDDGFHHLATAAARVALFADVSAALVPGGVFLLDVAGPDRAPAQPTRTFVEHPDWAVLMESSGADGILPRRITTFRRRRDDYRRDAEGHRLYLIEPDEIEAALQANGFHVRRSRGYDDTLFPPGLCRFVAQRSMDSGVV